MWIKSSENFLNSCNIYTLYYDPVWIEPQKFAYVVIVYLLDMTEAI
jgi:hypothetical protein